VTVDERTEVDALRARVAELEAERDELLRRTAATVAAAQERAYWLDRWHLDLNTLMANPWAGRLRGWARAVRGPLRAVRLLRRRLFR
jgi:hypothetical protein